MFWIFDRFSPNWVNCFSVYLLTHALNLLLQSFFEFVGLTVKGNVGKEQFLTNCNLHGRHLFPLKLLIEKRIVSFLECCIAEKNGRCHSRKNNLGGKISAKKKVRFNHAILSWRENKINPDYQSETPQFKICPKVTKKCNQTHTRKIRRKTKVFWAKWGQKPFSGIF